MIASDTRKTGVSFKTLKVAKIELTIKAKRSSRPGKDAVGFGEVELQLRK